MQSVWGASLCFGQTETLLCEAKNIPSVSFENLTVLEGRKIVLFPDLGAFDQWSLKANHMQELGYEVELFDYLERNASAQQRREGYDIADFLLQIQPKESNLQMMINKNPLLKKLIDHFDLALEQSTKTVPENQMYCQKRKGIRL